jgi:autotransporter translocation and assembly factor TamB
MRLLPSRANVQVAGNTLDLDGSFGAARDKLKLKVDAPNWRAWLWLAGLLRLDGILSGTRERPNLLASFQAEQRPSARTSCITCPARANCTATWPPAWPRRTTAWP